MEIYATGRRRSIATAGGAPVFALVHPILGGMGKPEPFLAYRDKVGRLYRLR